jgi:predicted DNA-binding protein (MmcQ/YjbR family)
VAARARKVVAASTKKPKPNPRATPPKKEAAANKPVGLGTKAESALRAFALTFPGAVEEHPWGETATKVNKKVFAFFGVRDGGLAMSVKLARSAEIALTLPFASPTRYGLGKSGWVTAEFTVKEKPPVDLLRAWIDESYRAVAPKKLAAALDAT